LKFFTGSNFRDFAENSRTRTSSKVLYFLTKQPSRKEASEK